MNLDQAAQDHLNDLRWESTLIAAQTEAYAEGRKDQHTDDIAFLREQSVNHPQTYRLTWEWAAMYLEQSK